MMRLGLGALLAASAAGVARGEACTEQQMACVEARVAVLNEVALSDEACPDVEGAVADLVGCLGLYGCEGVDLQEAKELCGSLSSSGTCFADCTALDGSPNAANASEPEAASQVADDGAGGNPTFGPAKFLSEVALEVPGGDLFDVQWEADGLATTEPTVFGSDQVAVGVAGGLLRSFDGFGSLLWELASQGPAGTEFSGRPVVGAQGDLFVGDTAGFLYRIEADTGRAKQVWALGAGGVTGSPAAAAQYVFAVTKGPVGFPSTLHKVATEASAGAAWRVPVCAHDDLTLDWAVQGVTLTDTAAIVACKYQGFLDAFSSVSGEELWSAQVASAQDAISPAILGGALADSSGDLYVVTAEGVSKVSGSNGAVQWTTATVEPLMDQVAIDEATPSILALSVNGTLYQLSVDDGNVASSTQVADDGAATRPVMDAEGHVVFGSGSQLVFIKVEQNQTAAETNRVAMSAPVSSVGLSATGKLVVSTSTALVAQVAAFPSSTEAPSPSPTTLAPTAQTSSPTTKTSSPTTKPSSPAPPTSSPTAIRGNTDDAPPVTAPETDNKWPHPAIITVSTLAAVDVVLIFAAIGLRVTAKSSVNEPPSPTSTDGAGERMGDDDKSEPSADKPVPASKELDPTEVPADSSQDKVAAA